MLKTLSQPNVKMSQKPSFQGISEYVDHLKQGKLPKTENDLEARGINALDQLFRMSKDDALIIYDTIEKHNYQNDTSGGFKTFLCAIAKKLKEEGDSQALETFTQDLKAVGEKFSVIS